MPLKFWKRDKGDKEKEKAEPEATKAPETPAAGPETKAPVDAASPGGAATVTVTQPAEPSPGPAPASAPTGESLDACLAEAHAGLVDLGLTIPATKVVFEKRAAGFPGGAPGFVDMYKAAPYRATTRLLADWLGFRAPSDFDPETLLKDVNLRLSSFKMAIKMSDLNWLDQDLGLRKARLGLDGQEKVVRFKDARDFIKGINEILGSKKVVFLELETWSTDFAFILAREPKWDKLASTNLVVVKAPQTAVGGECGECGAPVGTNWHDCLSCGAVFGSD